LHQTFFEPHRHAQLGPPCDPRREAMKRSDYAVMAAALISLATSIYLWFGGHRDEGLFVGLWVPSILSFAAYVRLSTARK
jgi:hypothetical protein